MDDDLVIFLLTCREMSFTRAGQALRVSGQAVSQRIRRFEHRLGVALLHRSARSLDLTEAGRVLLEYAAQAFPQWEKTKQHLLNPDQNTEPWQLRLGLMPTRPQELADHLSGTVAGINLDWLSDNQLSVLLDRLRDGELDAVYAFGVPTEPVPTLPGISLLTIVHEPLWVILSRHHRFAERAELTIAELADDTWIINPPSDSTHRWEHDLLAGIGVTQMISTTGNYVYRHLDDEGVCALATPLARTHDRHVIVPLVDPTPTWHLYLAWNPLTVPESVALALQREIRNFYRSAARDVPAYWQRLVRTPAVFPGIATPDAD